MAEIKEYQSIPKKVETGDDLDFAFLRKKGMEFIERLSGQLWTDFNSHDPGITILEVLCYAITDLSARINLPIEDLLTSENKTETFENQFFTANHILTSKPVSENDYRKLFIDIDGVKNCWLLPYRKTVYFDCKNDKISYSPALLKYNSGNFELQGLYRIIVDFDKLNDTKFPDESDKLKEIQRITDEITRLYHANRNLCEDLVDIQKVKTHPIRVCASFDIAPLADEEMIHAKVLRTIEDYFSPKLKFYSLAQMLAKGYKAEEIFEGPLLQNGFIDVSELENTRLKNEVRLSDLVAEIMKIDGINAIKDISIQDGNSENDEKKWVIKVEEGKKPQLTFDSAFSYYKGVLPVNINRKKSNQYKAELELKEKIEQALAKTGMFFEFPVGEFSETGETTTIQNDFPETYGIGKFGLPANATTERKAQTLQLQGYLLFFDQLLSNYFAHLAKFKDLLSVNQTQKTTWFAQAIQDVNRFEKLVNDYDSDLEKLTEKLFEHIENDTERKNEILDHLIARFAEKFSEYAFLMKQLYGDYGEKATVEAKEKFLAEYGDLTDGGKVINRGIGNWRGSAFNYFRQPHDNLWDTDNVSGIEKRVARLAGIKNYNRRNLTSAFAEIYSFLDSENLKVYRWRIRDHSGQIILSATQNYLSIKAAQTELYFVVVKILETSEKEVQEAFKNAVSDEMEVGNFEIQQSELGKFSFDVINREADPESVDRIVARQYSYSTTKEELRDSILELIRFMASEFTEEGLFVVENILLRPDVTQNEVPLNQFMPVCFDDCNSCDPADPYSFRVTVVFPGWTHRFSNPAFRQFMEELVRTEMPAHILARICWIGDRPVDQPENENDMIQFEKHYKAFLLSKTNVGQGQNSNKLKALIKILGNLNSIYPEGRLIDCDDESDTIAGRVVLGSTRLGKL